MQAINKYYKRYKSNQRPGQEQLDLLKIAHYACMAYWKREENPEQSKKEVVLLSGNFESIGQDINRLEEDISEELEDGKTYEIILREV